MRSPAIHPTSSRLRGFAAAAAIALLAVSCTSPDDNTSSPTESQSPSATPASYQVSIGAHQRYQRSSGGSWQELAVYAPYADCQPDCTREGPRWRREPWAMGGPWPTVVMINGAGGGSLDDWAYEVARQGAVVFVPLWRDRSRQFTTLQRTERIFGDVTEQLACAVKYARSRTAGYGGDASYLSLFGFSAGANLAAQVAFNEPKNTPGCLATAESATPDNLVLMDGDWLMPGAYWDPLLREGPGFRDLYLPWSHLTTAPRMPVHILNTADPAWDIKVSDIGPTKTWLPMRDPTGELQRGLEQRNAFDDGTLTLTEHQQLLYDQLRQRYGYEATFDTLPDSEHGHEALDTAAQLEIAIEAIFGDWEPPDS